MEDKRALEVARVKISLTRQRLVLLSPNPSCCFHTQWNSLGSTSKLKESLHAIQKGAIVPRLRDSQPLTLATNAEQRRMLAFIILALATLACSACDVNPTNPSCPLYTLSRITEAEFDVAKLEAFIATPSDLTPVIALSNNVNVYFHSDGNLVV